MSPRYFFGRGECPVCHRVCALNANGRIHMHHNPAVGGKCDGVDRNPAATRTEEASAE